MKTTSEHRSLGELWNSIQSWLFPALEDEIGELDEKHRQFVAVCELCAPQDHMAAYRWVGNGCPPSDRLALCKAFIAKAVWNFATTRDLIDAIRHRPTLRRLCGWETLGEVPSEATFSRAFDAFARDGRPQRIHEALLEAHYHLFGACPLNLCPHLFGACPLNLLGPLFGACPLTFCCFPVEVSRVPRRRQNRRMRKPADCPPRPADRGVRLPCEDVVLAEARRQNLAPTVAVEVVGEVDRSVTGPGPSGSIAKISSDHVSPWSSLTAKST